MLSQYHGASAGIYLCFSFPTYPTDRYTSSPTSLQDQSNYTMFNHYIIPYMDLENMAKTTDTLVSFPCAMKGAQHFTLLKLAPMELVNYS